ncbi:hypothetical protein B0H13DRAFT_1889359 [Mycena leptocephala]|nr:hypothetical protein B0H13DRAFT_1889359 [Mycena leptocephala]
MCYLRTKLHDFQSQNYLLFSASPQQEPILACVAAANTSGVLSFSVFPPDQAYHPIRTHLRILAILSSMLGVERSYSAQVALLSLRDALRFHTCQPTVLFFSLREGGQCWDTEISVGGIGVGDRKRVASGDLLARRQELWVSISESNACGITFGSLIVSKCGNSHNGFEIHPRPSGKPYDAEQDFNAICDPDFKIYSAQLSYNPPFTHSSSDPEPEIIRGRQSQI